MNKIVFGIEQHNVKGEDFACAFESYDEKGNILYGALVADGHGGNQVACISKLEIPKIFDEVVKNMGVVDTLKYSFKLLQEKCKNEMSGCALTVCILYENVSKVACANVGDVNAYMYQRGNPHGILLSTSHNFMDSSEERERVRLLGIDLVETTNGVQFSVLRAWPGGLAMGRSIGDSDCNEYVMHEPSISVTNIRHLRSIVICTDGVWNNLDSKQVHKRLAYNEGKPRLTAKSIVGKAFSKNQSDDTTCLIMEPYVHYTPNLLNMLSKSGDSSISLSSTSSEEEEDDKNGVKTVLKISM